MPKNSEHDKTQIEADIAALKETIGGDDGDLIKAKTDALAQSAMKLGEAIYAQLKGRPDQTSPGRGGPG